MSAVPPSTGYAAALLAAGAEGFVLELLAAAADPIAFLRAARVRHPAVGTEDAVEAAEAVARAATAGREASLEQPPRPGDVVLVRPRAAYVALGASRWEALLPGAVVIHGGDGVTRAWRRDAAGVVVERCYLGGDRWSDPHRVEGVVDMEAAVRRLGGRRLRDG